MGYRILSMDVKKVIRWATGYAVFVTKEAKQLKWNDKTQVVIQVIQDDEGEGILIRKAPISSK